MRTKPVTRDELLAMAGRAQARPIADHYTGKRTGKGACSASKVTAWRHLDIYPRLSSTALARTAKAEPEVAGLTVVPFALLKERHPAFTPAFDRLRQRFEAGDEVAWTNSFFSTTMHSFKNPVLVHEKDADGRDVYFYLGNDIHIGRETLGVGAQTWTADMEDALVDVVKAELSIEQLGGGASTFAAGASPVSGTCAEGAAAAWPAEGARAIPADYGKPVAIAPLKYSGGNKESRGPHFDPSGYTVIAGLSLTGYATLGFSRQRRKVVKEVLLRPGDLYILRGEAVHGWQHRLSAPYQQDEGDDRVVLLLRYVSRDKLEQSLGMLQAAAAASPGLAMLATAESGHQTRARTAGHSNV
jgi:hypothetical protein